MFFVFFVTFYGDPNPDSYRMKGGEWLEAERSQPSGLLEDPGPYYSQPVLDTLLHILGGTAVCWGAKIFWGSRSQIQQFRLQLHGSRAEIVSFLFVNCLLILNHEADSKADSDP